jgi:hypothetical protein
MHAKKSLGIDAKLPVTLTISTPSPAQSIRLLADDPELLSVAMRYKTWVMKSDGHDILAEVQAELARRAIEHVLAKKD